MSATAVPAVPSVPALPDRQDPGNIVLRILHAPNPFLTMNGAALTFRQACQGCFLHPVSKAVGALSAFMGLEGSAEALTKVFEWAHETDCLIGCFFFPTWAKVRKQNYKKKLAQGLTCLSWILDLAWRTPASHLIEQILSCHLPLKIQSECFVLSFFLSCSHLFPLSPSLSPTLTVIFWFWLWLWLFLSLSLFCDLSLRTLNPSAQKMQDSCDSKVLKLGCTQGSARCWEFFIGQPCWIKIGNTLCRWEFLKGLFGAWSLVVISNTAWCLVVAILLQNSQRAILRILPSVQFSPHQCSSAPLNLSFAMWLRLASVLSLYLSHDLSVHTLNPSAQEMQDSCDPRVLKLQWRCASQDMLRFLHWAALLNKK